MVACEGVGRGRELSGKEGVAGAPVPCSPSPDHPASWGLGAGLAAASTGGGGAREVPALRWPAGHCPFSACPPTRGPVLLPSPSPGDQEPHSARAAPLCGWTGVGRTGNLPFPVGAELGSPLPPGARARAGLGTQPGRPRHPPWCPHPPSAQRMGPLLALGWTDS